MAIDLTDLGPSSSKGIDLSDLGPGDQPKGVGLFKSFQAASDLAPWNVVRRNTLDPAGEGVAEEFGRTGHPAVGAAFGTAIQMAPEIIQAGTGLSNLYQSGNPIVKGLINTPQELGPEYEALDKSAGVSGKLPVQRGTIPKFPGLDGLPKNVPPPEAPNVSPVSYPKDTNTYLNFVRDRLDSVGKNLSPQELADHKTILSNLMKKMAVDGQAGTQVFAKAAQAQSDLTGLQNSAIPGRDSLNRAYGISKGLQGITKRALKAGAWAGGGAGSLFGLDALRRALSGK